MRQEVFFAAYIGSSMNPTLREPEIMEIAPPGGRSLRAGDVVLFLPPGSGQPIVHRITRVTPAGILTAGDNNSLEDAFLLGPQDIQGQVVAAWRGQKRRDIAGGLPGRLRRRWLRRRRLLVTGVTRLLHPCYHALSRTGLLARLLPAPFRPQVVVFQSQGRDQLRLLLGQNVIGQYDERTRQWQIQRPFRLLVDERALPRQQDGSK